MMKLWILKPRTDIPEKEDPWIPWFDKCFRAVVRAETEEKARQLLADEGNGEETDPYYKDIALSPWLTASKSMCIELLTEGEAELIIEDISYA